MHRFLAAAIALCTTFAADAAQGPSATIVVQNAPLAGFIHYDGRDVWERIRVGDRLDLVRERDNAHDANAVRLEWQGRMLGYVPRKDNSDLARQMDFGAPVHARVTELIRSRNGRNRISYEITVPLR